jgi:methylated-DNA-[protein]-cysteine S-methyltransferase
MNPYLEHDVLLCREISSPVGQIALFADAEALLAIEFVAAAGRNAPLSGKTNDILSLAERQLAAYFAGHLRVFDLPLRPIGTDFQLVVWQAMQEISYGEVMTYGDLAERVGSRNKARAVGQAANKNPLPIVIPCHRVIGSGNRLTGFAPGLDLKAFLLRHERGAEVWRDR